MTNTSLKQMYHNAIYLNSKVYDFRVWKVVHPKNVSSLADNYRLTIMSKDGKEWIELKFSTLKRLYAYLETIISPYLKKRAAA